MEVKNTGINQVAAVQLQTQASPHNSGTKSAASVTAVTAPPQANPQQEEKNPATASLRDLQESVDAMNDFVQPLNNSLQFSVDEDTGKTVVKVIDLTTKEVIKQMPSEEALAIAKALGKLKGLLIHQQV